MFITFNIPSGLSGAPTKGLNIHSIVELSYNRANETTVTYLREGQIRHMTVEGSQEEVTEAINALFEREAAAGSHRPSSIRTNQRHAVRAPA